MSMFENQICLGSECLALSKSSTTNLRNISLSSQIKMNAFFKDKLKDTNHVSFMRKFFPEQYKIPKRLNNRIITSEDVDFTELQKVIGLSERKFHRRI